MFRPHDLRNRFYATKSLLGIVPKYLESKVFLKWWGFAFSWFSEHNGLKKLGFSKWFEGPGRFEMLRVNSRRNPTLTSCQSDFMVPNYDQTIEKHNDEESNNCFNACVMRISKITANVEYNNEGEPPENDHLPSKQTNVVQWIWGLAAGDETSDSLFGKNRPNGIDIWLHGAWLQWKKLFSKIRYPCVEEGHGFLGWDLVFSLPRYMRCRLDRSWGQDSGSKYAEIDVYLIFQKSSLQFLFNKVECPSSGHVGGIFGRDLEEI